MAKYNCASVHIKRDLNEIQSDFSKNHKF